MTLQQRDKAAEILWKWALRLSGLGTFFYILLEKDLDEVPAAVYIMIGGLIGLPNVISWQQALNRGALRPEEDEEG